VSPAPPEFDLARCLALSDVIVSAVPSATYKVRTAALKDGCVCVNVAGEKNFEADVRDKVRFAFFIIIVAPFLMF
jgi:methylenetetrahydrofolate dehydrogenase (NAD+)